MIILSEWFPGYVDERYAEKTFKGSKKNERESIK